MHTTLTPAYGRDYKSKKEVLAAFNANLDFMVQPSSQYTTRSELVNMGVKAVNIRYKKLAMVCVVNDITK